VGEHADRDRPQPIFWFHINRPFGPATGPLPRRPSEEQLELGAKPLEASDDAADLTGLVVGECVLDPANEIAEDLQRFER
jgi:hypothetical protein